MMNEAGMKDPKVKKWLPLGILLSTVSPAAARFFHPTGKFNQDLVDGLAGLLAGIGFGILIALVVRMSRKPRPSGS